MPYLRKPGHGANNPAIATIIWQYLAIQAVPSACSRYPAGRQGGTAIKDANIVQSQETAFKDILTESILTVHPPGEVQHQLPKDMFEKLQVTLAPEFFSMIYRVHGGPGMHRRIHIAKIPLIGRESAPLGCK